VRHINKQETIKPELVAFSENVLGGIQTFYLNLLTHDSCSLFEKRWLLIDHCDEKRAKAPSFHLESEKISYCNKHGRWRKAIKLTGPISKRDGLVLVNREFELDALFLYPIVNKTVYHIVHDDYYLQFASQYQSVIDVYIAHNRFIYNELMRLLPERKNEVFFIPFGIRLSPFQRSPNYETALKVAFIARLDVLKGIHELVQIDDLLKDKQVKIEWLVIGDGPEKDKFLNDINDRDNFRHLIAKDDLEIFNNIKSCDVFILPSVHDGTPVALLESMGVGLVPILYRFNDGIQEVVTNDIGYVVEKNDCQRIAEIIAELHSNRDLLEQKSKNALQSARTNYDVVKQSKAYYDIFSQYKHLKKFRAHPNSLPIPFLERTWIPQKAIDVYESAKFWKRKLLKTFGV